MDKYENPNPKIFEGWLDKRSRFLHKWRSRFVILIKTHLITYSSENFKTVPTEKILLKYCKGIKSTYDEIKIHFTFKIIFKEECFYFKAKNSEDYNKWLKAITKALISKKLRFLGPIYTDGESSDEEDEK